jgi:hypothetical protein
MNSQKNSLSRAGEKMSKAGDNMMGAGFALILLVFVVFVLVALLQLNATVNSLTGHTGTNIANGYQPGLGAFGTPRVGKPSVGGFLGNAKNTLSRTLGSSR